MGVGISRRGFLVGTAAAALAGPWITPGRAWGQDGPAPPSERIGLGFVGCGAMNSGHMRNFANRGDVQVVAVCDVIRSKREEAKSRIEEVYAEATKQSAYAGCAAYSDFRELIADPNVDAVVVATPDHWHTLPALAAVRVGKHVYVEKPMTLTIEEGRVLADEVKRTGRRLQVGSHQRSVGPFRQAVALARTGKLGRLERVEAGIYSGPSGGVAVEEPVPDGFDYEMWLGQAPWRPYSPAFTQGVRPWMYISDFSGGRPTEWGSHHFDIAQWGMGADDTGPVEIEGVGVFPESGLYDCLISWRIEMRYANGVTMLSADETHIPQGVKFVGDEGWVFVNRDKIEAEPASLLALRVSSEEAGLIESTDHAGNWIKAIRDGSETVCNAEVGHRTATLCHLTNICAKLRRKLRWDPAGERFEDDPEADAMISRAMRAPWSLNAV